MIPEPGEFARFVRVKTEEEPIPKVEPTKLAKVTAADVLDSLFTVWCHSGGILNANLLTPEMLPVGRVPVRLSCSVKSKSPRQNQRRNQRVEPT